MVNLVNAIIEKYGKPDEIRIELARELKQSKDERNAADLKMSKRQRENEIIASRLEEYGLRATKIILPSIDYMKKLKIRVGS